jgi:hypothetical protein
MPSRQYIHCTDISPQCPLEATIYGYDPSLGANVFFAVFFALFATASFSLGYRYRTWSYCLAMTLAGIAEVIGYIGRILLHYNAWSKSGFNIQICCLIIAPAFNSAAIYLVLKHITLCFGEPWSRIKPRLYTYIFVSCDILSLALQAAGGAMAATSRGNEKRQTTGDELMIAGISLQVATLLCFGIAASDYIWRRHRASQPLNHEAAGFVQSRMFRFFALGLVAAYMAIFVRCVYRIVEMAGGWRNAVMQNEAAFIALDGW